MVYLNAIFESKEPSKKGISSFKRHLDFSHLTQNMNPFSNAATYTRKVFCNIHVVVDINI